MKTVKFSYLSKLNDSNSLVWTDLKVKGDELNDMNDWFHEIGLIPKDKNLIELRPISGNIKGKKGRSDVLLIFDENTKIHPLVRLNVDGLMWTSDFIHNYKNEYSG